MKATELVKSRRSIREWEPLGVSRETIATLLDAAVYAPNHHLSQPWRFTVVLGEAKDRLAAARGAAKAAGFPDPESAEARSAAERSRAEMADAAAVVVFTCVEAADPLRAREDLCATAAAAENFCIAACGEGLGTFWTTGPLAASPAIRPLLQIPADERIVAIILLGYPASVPPVRRRKPAADLTRWLEQ
jgi:nitroreductase